MKNVSTSYASVSLVALALGGAFAAPALAQEASGPAASSEIVVTAQRRAQTLEEAPVSVSVVSPETIENFNITSIGDVQFVTPGLTFDAGFGYAQPFIRGIGVNFANGLESPVASYIDGVYQSRSLGELTDNYDIANIQTVKGAQGTLYGRNATGGVILVETAKPTNKFEAMGTFEYGKYDHYKADGAINIPLAENVALRLSALYLDEDGYIDNLFDGSKLGGRETKAIRGQLKVDFTNAFDALLKLEYRKTDDFNNALTQRLPAPLCAACAVFGVTPVTDTYSTSLDTVSPFESRTYAATLRLNYDAGSFDITSVTGFRDDRTHVLTDQDYTSANLSSFEANPGGETYTEDLLLSTKFAGRYNFLAGVSYLHDVGEFRARLGGLGLAPFHPDATNQISTDSYSAFLEANIDVTDKIGLTVGGRYTKDERTIEAWRNSDASAGLGIPAFVPAVFSQDASFDSFTPRVVLTYDADFGNYYASWSRGFKAGGFGTPIFVPTTPVSPEKINNYEIGAKFVSDDRKARFNAAAFYFDYNDVQVNIVDITSGGQRTENAATARGYGIELDGTYQATNWLNFIGNISWLDTEFTSYPNASVAIPTALGLTAGVADLKGSPLLHAPEWSGAVGVNLTTTFSNGWEGDLNAIARYTDEYDFYPGRSGPLGYDFQPATTVLNITGDVGTERLKVGFYVDNATDETYYLQRSTSQPLGVFDQVAKPRTFGIRISARN